MPTRHMKGKISRWGKSLAIRIPHAIVRRAGLEAGDTVELTIAAGTSGIRRRVSSAPRLAELVAQITPENRHAEIGLGRLRGKEPPGW